MSLSQDIKSIVVPVDFSPFSDQALHYALQLAGAFQASVTLLHAVVLLSEQEEQGLQAYSQWAEEQEKQVFRQMSARKMLAASQGIQVHSEIVRGISPWDAILDFLQEHPVDLVVLGTHGHTGFKHFLQGSVAEKIVRLAPVPVMTVHRSVKQFRLSHILVPIDFSQYALSALDYAISLGQAFAARLTLLHVVERDVYPSIYSDVQSVFEVDPVLKQQIVENLQELVSLAGGEDLVGDIIVLEGKAHKQIVEFAATREVDLVVIATHGLSELDYFLLGSTTEKVARWSPAPVLVVKKP